MIARRVRGPAAIGLAVLLAACSHAGPWELHNVSGFVPSLHFSMTDQNGGAVRARDYRGKIVAVYFGYTHCTDACPVTVAKLASALHRLGPAASRVRVLFVTVDPARDTPAVLKHYLSSFGPQFVGLRGSDHMLRALARRYRVTYQAVDDQHGDLPVNYEVTHSNGIFIFGPDGTARLVATPYDGVTQIAHDLRRLTAADLS